MTFTGATNYNLITVQGDAPNSGIYSIQLQGVSYSSTNYVSGVQTTASNTFPDSGVLADGQYTATVTSLSGQTSQASFTRGGRSSFDEGAPFAVFGEARLSGLKLGDVSLPYRQAG